MKPFRLICLFGISSCYALSAGQTILTSSAGPTILTSSGPVRGHAATDEPGVSAFLGIPYALPPVGKRRFMPPERYHGKKLINANSIVSRFYIPLGFELALTQFLPSGIRLPSNHTLCCR